ncbi:MAG: hypothetical protein ACTHK7_06815, partial [Aureliella sp.]
HDDDPDVLAPLPAPLHVMVNRCRLAEFIWPGYNPVVSSRVREKIGELPHVRFQEVVIEKAIDYAWAPGSELSIEPGNLTNREVFKKLKACSSQAIGPLYELQGLSYREIPAQVHRSAKLSIELGTPPLAQTVEVELSPELLKAFPLFFSGQSMIVVDHVFAKFEKQVDRLFFVVRENEVA